MPLCSLTWTLKWVENWTDLKSQLKAPLQQSWTAGFSAKASTEISQSASTKVWGQGVNDWVGVWPLFGSSWGTASMHCASWVTTTHPLHSFCGLAANLKHTTVSKPTPFCLTGSKVMLRSHDALCLTGQSKAANLFHMLGCIPSSPLRELQMMRCSIKHFEGPFAGVWKAGRCCSQLCRWSERVLPRLCKVTGSAPVYPTMYFPCGRWLMAWTLARRIQMRRELLLWVLCSP